MVSTVIKTFSSLLFFVLCVLFLFVSLFFFSRTSSHIGVLAQADGETMPPAPPPPAAPDTDYSSNESRNNNKFLSFIQEEHSCTIDAEPASCVATTDAVEDIFCGKGDGVNNSAFQFTVSPFTLFKVSAIQPGSSLTSCVLAENDELFLCHNPSQEEILGFALGTLAVTKTITLPSSISGRVSLVINGDTLFTIQEVTSPPQVEILRIVDFNGLEVMDMLPIPGGSGRSSPSAACITGPKTDRRMIVSVEPNRLVSIDIQAMGGSILNSRQESRRAFAFISEIELPTDEANPLQDGFACNNSMLFAVFNKNFVTRFDTYPNLVRRDDRLQIAPGTSDTLPSLTLFGVEHKFLLVSQSNGDFGLHLVDVSTWQLLDSIPSTATNLTHQASRPVVAIDPSIDARKDGTAYNVMGFGVGTGCKAYHMVARNLNETPAVYTTSTAAATTMTTTTTTSAPVGTTVDELPSTSIVQDAVVVSVPSCPEEDRCRVKHPQSGQCRCPSSTNERNITLLPSFAFLPSTSATAQLINQSGKTCLKNEFVMSICTATTNSRYLSNYIRSGGSSSETGTCEEVNPFTNDCSCLASSTKAAFAIVRGSSTSYVKKYVTFCLPVNSDLSAFWTIHPDLVSSNRAETSCVSPNGNVTCACQSGSTKTTFGAAIFPDNSSTAPVAGDLTFCKAQPTPANSEVNSPVATTGTVIGAVGGFIDGGSGSAVVGIQVAAMLLTMCDNNPNVSTSAAKDVVVYFEFDKAGRAGGLAFMLTLSMGIFALHIFAFVVVGIGRFLCCKSITFDPDRIDYFEEEIEEPTFREQIRYASLQLRFPHWSFMIANIAFSGVVVESTVLLRDRDEKPEIIAAGVIGMVLSVCYLFLTFYYSYWGLRNVSDASLFYTDEENAVIAETARLDEKAKQELTDQELDHNNVEINTTSNVLPDLINDNSKRNSDEELPDTTNKRKESVVSTNSDRHHSHHHHHHNDEDQEKGHKWLKKRKSLDHAVTTHHHHHSPPASQNSTRRNSQVSRPISAVDEDPPTTNHHHHHQQQKRSSVVEIVNLDTPETKMIEQHPTPHLDEDATQVMSENHNPLQGPIVLSPLAAGDENGIENNKQIGNVSEQQHHHAHDDNDADSIQVVDVDEDTHSQASMASFSSSNSSLNEDDLPPHYVRYGKTTQERITDSASCFYWVFPEGWWIKHRRYNRRYASMYNSFKPIHTAWAPSIIRFFMFSVAVASSLGGCDIPVIYVGVVALLVAFFLLYSRPCRRPFDNILLALQLILAATVAFSRGSNPELSVNLFYAVVGVTFVYSLHIFIMEIVESFSMSALEIDERTTSPRAKK